MLWAHHLKILMKFVLWFVEIQSFISLLSLSFLKLQSRTYVSIAKLFMQIERMSVQKTYSFNISTPVFLLTSFPTSAPSAPLKLAISKFRLEIRSANPAVGGIVCLFLESAGGQKTNCF